MEAKAKENFSENGKLRISPLLIQFHYTLLYGNIQQKKQNFLHEKEKVPKTSVKRFSGKKLFVYDGNGFHSLRLEGLVGPVGCNACDAVKNVEAFGQLTERCVRTVEMGCILVHNEELGACRVGVHGASHGDHASGVLQGVLYAVGRKFTLDLIAGTAHTRTGGVAALNHEACDNSVEDKSVIEALVCKLYEVFNRDRCDLGVKLKRHGAAIFHFNDCFCHFKNSFLIRKIIYGFILSYFTCKDKYLLQFFKHDIRKKIGTKQKQHKIDSAVKENIERDHPKHRKQKQAEKV